MGTFMRNTGNRVSIVGEGRHCGVEVGEEESAVLDWNSRCRCELMI